MDSSSNELFSYHLPVGQSTHNSALRFRSDSQRHTLGRGRSVTVCGGYNRAGDPGGWSLPLCAAVVIQREQTPAGVDDFLESLLTDGHS